MTYIFFTSAYGSLNSSKESGIHLTFLRVVNLENSNDVDFNPFELPSDALEHRLNQFCQLSWDLGELWFFLLFELADQILISTYIPV